MKLRLYHHSDGARVAYREAGTGPGLAILHSAMLSHKEWEPVVEFLSDRFRVVLPALPLHGDSEDRPRHPYTVDWMAEVMAGFVDEVVGPRPLVAGHELGAEVLLRAIAAGRLRPGKLVVMPTRLDAPPERGVRRRGWRLAARTGALPLANRVVGHGAKLMLRPEDGIRLSARGDAAAADVVRHAVADAGGNANLARSWARFARRWPPRRADSGALDELRAVDCPTLLLWADEDRVHPLAIAERAQGALRHGQLRVLQSTGFLMAYDDPAGVARELAAFLV